MPFKNSEAKKQYDQKRYLELRKTTIERTRKHYQQNKIESNTKSREYYRKNKEHLREYERIRYLEDKKKKARIAFNKALRQGLVTKEKHCSKCGRIPEPSHLHGHHDDYTKPLKVRWLCRECHGEEHRIIV